MRLYLPAALVVATALAGCFPFDGAQRKIVGDYLLHQWEDGRTYYLHRRGHDDSSIGGSIIGGTVLRLGWTEHYIAAERYSIFRGDPDGWMIIDVRSGEMSGPFTEPEFRARPEARSMKIYGAPEAWDSL